jgi:hypothetical protein
MESHREKTVKNIVLTGFGKITLLDLDMIDLSNLNRQFLFRKKDVKQSKSLVRQQYLASARSFAYRVSTGSGSDSICFQPKRQNHSYT